MKIKFNLMTFEDIHKLGLKQIMDEIFKFMENEIDSGNLVIIELRYSNKPPDILYTINSRDLLNTFRENINMVVIKIIHY